AIGAAEPALRGKCEFEVDRGRRKEPSWFAGDRLVHKSAFTGRMQGHSRVELADWSVVVLANDFVVTSFDPFERVFVPTEAPTQVSRFADLVGAAVLFRHILKGELRQSRKLIDAVGIRDISPKPVRRRADREIPFELKIHTPELVLSRASGA